jgi:hypothetical protein
VSFVENPGVTSADLGGAAFGSARARTRYPESFFGQKLIQDVALRENVRTDREPTGDLLKLKGLRYMKTNWDSIFGNLEVHHKALRENFGCRSD